MTQEDARATYTGALFASTASSSATTVTVTLSATVQDISATSDVTGESYPGDIQKATVQLVFLSNNSDLLCTATAISLVNADTRTGTAACSFPATAPTAGDQSNTYQIGIVVGGYYLYNTKEPDALLTVTLGGAGFITGGGYIINQAEAGTYAGTASQRTNFGFNVKYTKSGTNLQGHANIIVRRVQSDGVHIYQIKTNQITSLSSQVGTSTTPGTATFLASATIQDVTDPLHPISLVGGASLKMTITDWGEPGSKDLIGFAVTDSKSGQLYFSCNWSGTITKEQLLDGGNTQVR